MGGLLIYSPVRLARLDYMALQGRQGRYSMSTIVQFTDAKWAGVRAEMEAAAVAGAAGSV